MNERPRQGPRVSGRTLGPETGHATTPSARAHGVDTCKGHLEKRVGRLLNAAAPQENPEPGHWARLQAGALGRAHAKRRRRRRALRAGSAFASVAFAIGLWVKLQPVWKDDGGAPALSADSSSGVKPGAHTSTSSTVGLAAPPQDLEQAGVSSSTFPLLTVHPSWPRQEQKNRKTIDAASACASGSAEGPP